MEGINMYIYHGRNIKTGETIMLQGNKAIKAAGFDPSNVQATALGRHLHHKGWTWTRTQTTQETIK